MSCLRLVIVLCASIALLPRQIIAAELPQWEAGIGMSGLSIPDYRGADHNQLYLFPIPYLIYRGEAFKVDRKSVRGIFYRSERLELDTSFSGSPPAKSGKNGARQGMPDLDPSLEAGPSLKYLLMRSPGGRLKVDLQLPLRIVFLTDFSYVRYNGLVFNPRLNFDASRFGPGRRWSVGSAFGPLFIDTRNSRYYYSVDPLYAAPGRPAYTAHGGYAGMQFILSGTAKVGSAWAGAFVRVDSVDGARFADSPLVRATWNVTTGLAVSWVFGVSAEYVEAEE